MLDLLTRPDVLAARAGGVPGAHRRRRRRLELGRPAAAADFEPPVDLRWPEYVTTARGEEWWIPTPHEGTGAGERL